MIVRTDLYDRAEVVSQTDWQYQIEVADGNDVGLEWVDKVKCETVKEET